MSTMDVWSMTKADLEAVYSQVLDLAVSGLINDGLLAEDAGTMWAASHAIIVRKRSQLSSWVKRLFGWPNDDRYRVMLVTLTTKDKDQHGESLPSPLEGGD